MFSKKGYSHLLSQQQPQISAEELGAEAQTLLPPGTSLPDTEWNDVAGELYVLRIYTLTNLLNLYNLQRTRAHGRSTQHSCVPGWVGGAGSYQDHHETVCPHQWVLRRGFDRDVDWGCVMS